MTKTIIVPTDFSDNAWNALKYAVELHERVECEIHIIHTHDMQFYNIADLKKGKSDGFSNEIERERAENQLQQLKEKASDLSSSSKHTFSTHFILGELFDGLVTFIEKHPAQLIIMGTKGITNYRVKAYGSNTVRVLNDMRKCDIIAVPNDVSASDCKEIVFSSNFDSTKHINLMHELKEIATATNASVRLLFVGSGAGLIKSQAAARNEIVQVLHPVENTFHEITNTNVYDGIRNFVESRDSDMISFINEEQGFFKRMFSTTLVNELGKFSKVPLLILQERA